MKIKYFITLSMLLAAQTVSAIPLLEKITTPGFVLPEYAISKSCVIHRSGSLVQRYNLGQLSSTRTTALKLSFATIKAAIDNAALGTLTTGTSMADTGRIEYYAYQGQPDGSLKKIVLWQTGEIAPQTNNAPEAKLLRNFIDLNCGEPLLQ